MANQPPSFRFPFNIEGKADSQVVAAVRYAFNALKDHTDAIGALDTKVKTNTAQIVEVNTTVNQAQAGGGGGTTPVSPTNIGAVNLQPDLTPGAYTLAQTDFGGLILINDAVPFALSLLNGLTTPFFTTVFNLGTQDVTATPTLNQVNNGASVTIKPNQLAVIYFDGADWWAVFPLLAQTFAPIAGEFLTGYDAATGLFTAAAASTSSFADAEMPAGVIDGVNAVFTLAHSPSPAASLILVENGMVQTAGGSDYTLAGSTITFVTPPAALSTLVAWYRY